MAAEANERIIQRLEELERRVEMLEDQWDNRRADVAQEEQERRRQPRYYAVARGKFVEEVDDFITGIFETLEEYHGAVDGATRPEMKSFSTRERAEDYMREVQERVEIQNSTFRDDNGKYSPQWYACWCTRSGDYDIVADYSVAQEFAKGSTHLIKKYPDYIKARNRCEEEYHKIHVHHEALHDIHDTT